MPNTPEPTLTGLSIRLRQCGKAYGSQQVLQPIDLDIAAGETLVLLGPSGCGKTTLLRIIAGLEAPAALGRVWFGEEDVTAVPIEQRHVGMVFQSYALFPNMNVRDNVEYGLKVRKMPAAQRSARALQMLEMMEIAELQDRRIDQLSGGQRQRVALARAIAPRPGVLLLDEPLTALDAQLRETLRAEINRLLRSLGVTAVYVTHDQAEAMALGDRIAVMDQGCISQVGTPQDVYHRPANRFVAGFIGTMNQVRLQGRPLGFRPEDARLVDAGDGAARFVAEVVQRQFLGDRTELRLRCVDAAAQAAFITVNVGPREAPELDARVGVAVDDAALLPMDMSQ